MTHGTRNRKQRSTRISAEKNTDYQYFKKHYPCHWYSLSHNHRQRRNAVCDEIQAAKGIDEIHAIIRQQACMAISLPDRKAIRAIPLKNRPLSPRVKSLLRFFCPCVQQPLTPAFDRWEKNLQNPFKATGGYALTIHKLRTALNITMPHD